MDIVTDMQFYVDPALMSDGQTPPDVEQATAALRLCVNSPFPFINDSVGAGGSSFFVGQGSGVNTPIWNMQVPKDPTATRPNEYNLATPTSALTAFCVQGLTDQGDYSIARKFERAYVSGARVEVFAEPVLPAAGVKPVQPGILSVIPHIKITSPINVSTLQTDLNLIAPRQSRRINPPYQLAAGDSGNASLASGGLSRQVKMNQNVSVAKLHGVTDLRDNLDDFAFTLGTTTDTGTQTNFGVPLEKTFVTIGVTPSLNEVITGTKSQATAFLLKVRLKQRYQFVEPRSHSTKAGVDWNIAQPKSNYGYAQSMLMGGLAAAQGIRRHQRGRLHVFG